MFDRTPADRWYNCMPLYHGTGALMVMSQLGSGGSIAIGRTFSLKRFWSDVRDSQATIFVYVGETARYLLSNPPSSDDRRHKVRLVIGNGLRPDVWRKFQERFGMFRERQHTDMATFFPYFAN